MKKHLWRIGEKEVEYVKKAIGNGLTGKFLRRFEAEFALKFGIEYAIAVNSATSALHGAMVSLDIGPGDEVIVPPLTFISTAFCALYVGAVPVFADIDLNTLNIDPKAIESKITSRTKAIVCVSLYGLPPDLEGIMRVARNHNLFVIEDNAQCILGKFNEKLVGTFGDYSIFSLQRSKHLTTGDGGVAITSNEKLAEKFRKICDLGYRNLTAKPITNEDFKEKIQQHDFKRHELVGYNFRMPEVCAAMGIAQLEKMEDLINRRIAIAKLYEQSIDGCDWLVPQRISKKVKHTYWTYVLRIDRKKTKITWKKFREAYINNSGDTFYGAWSLNYLEPALRGMEFPAHNIKYELGLCPVAESVQPNIIQLKTNYESTEYALKQASALKTTIQELGG